MKYLVLLPALVHVYIFVLESLLWGKPATNKAFGLRAADAEPVRPFAFNQGVYNLLLALAVVVGWCLWMGFPSFEKGPFAGKVLMIYGLGSILIAGLTLLASAPRLWRASLLQIVPALLALAVLFVSEM